MQTILEQAGKIKTGKKKVLQDRIINLLQNDKTNNIKDIIVELYMERMVISSNLKQTNNQTINSTTINTDTCEVHAKSQNYNNIQDLKINKKIFRIQNNGNFKFKKLPFYDVLCELVKPIELPNLQASSSLVANFESTLTLPQCKMIKDGYNSQTYQFDTSILFRFCMIEPGLEQNDFLPVYFVLKINDVQYDLPVSCLIYLKCFH